MKKLKDLSKKVSIKWMLLSTIVIVSLMIFICVGYFSNHIFLQVSSSQVREILTAQVKEQSSMLENQIGDVAGVALELSNAMSSLKSYDQDFIEKYIAHSLENKRLMFGAGVWSEPNVLKKNTQYYGPYVYRGDGDKPVLSFDYSNEAYNYFQYDWYKEGMASNGKVVYSKAPYYDKVLGTTFLTCSTSFALNGNAAGVVTADITLKEIREYIRQIKVNGKGYAFLITSDGSFWGKSDNPEKDLTEKITDDAKYAKIGQEALNTKNPGYMELKDNNELIAYSPIGDTGLKLILIYPRAEAFSFMNQVSATNAISIILGIGLFVLIVSLLLDRMMGRPMKSLVNNINKLSKGDYSDDSDSLWLKGLGGEFGVLAASVWEMRRNMMDRIVAVEKVSYGDLDVDVVMLSGEDKLSASLNHMIGTIKSLTKEIGILTEGAQSGNLHMRGKDSEYQGAFAEIVMGINNTLDAVLEPVEEAKQVLEELAGGNLGVHVSGTYKGEHAVIKEALNNTIETLNGYIGDISNVLGSISKGQLNLSITREYHGDFKAIKDSLQWIVDSLNRKFYEINSVAIQVAVGSEQVSTNAQSLSQGAAEQASAVEEINVTVAQVSEQTLRNSEKVKSANELSITTKEYAEKGNERMGDMTKAIIAINESSVNISRIIKVIDEIAFQTNILALNAAVEAARAGQYGKGFAVVADEVRNLAARSAEAAKETTVLIEESIKSAENGARIVGETGKALDNILQSVAKSTGLFYDITCAFDEQSTAVSQIHQAMGQITDVTHINSAAAQESAASSEELSSMALVLRDLLSDLTLIQQDQGNDQAKAFKEVSVTRKKSTIQLNSPWEGRKDYGKY